MSFLTIIGSAVLAFFLWVGSRVNSGEEESSVPASTTIAIIVIIALAGFLIAAGLFV